MNKTELAKEMKKKCLVLDIETYSDRDIRKDFKGYVETAKIKWVGLYSYLTGKYYEINVNNMSNPEIIKFINKHNTIITWNGEDFDIPVMKNNNMYPTNSYMTSLDLKHLLHIDKSDFRFKGRGGLMGYKFKSKSLRKTAKIMKVKTQKGDIDYMIFKKDSWNSDETKEIKKYLRGDIEATKQIFDKMFDFWLVFTEFVSEKNVKNWSWMKSAIAALVYKSACYEMGWDEEYGSKGGKTDVGGKVLLPRVEEETDVWYVDVTSLYPNIYIMFNLVDETSSLNINAWHGNEVFKVKGYYNIKEQHKLTKSLYNKLKGRIKLKKEDNKNPLIYAYKIFLNTFYGVSRSKVFKKIYTENSGSDCCYLGQQVNEIMEEKLTEMGYDVLYGDTDSNMIKYRIGKVTEEKVISDLKKVVEYIKQYVPFPSETFNIDIEHKLDYIMFVPDIKTGEFKKKNYVYLYTDKKSGDKKVKVMGLPIKKTNSTQLGPLIFKKYIEPRIIKEKKGKFPKSWLKNIVTEEVKNNIELMAQEYNVSNYDFYPLKSKGCISAQISKNYLNGKGGRIKLIKNKRIGKVGSSFKYCTVEEAEKYNLKYYDLDLTKVFNELTPFIEGSFGKNVKNGFFNKDGKTSVGMKLKAKGYF